MTITNFFSWNWSIGLILAAAVVMGGYVWINRFNNVRKTFFFMSGLIVGELALALPLGPAPIGYTANPLSCCLPGGILVSMHMIRSMLLLLVVPPLLVLGLPEEPLKNFIYRHGFEKFVKIMSDPRMAWIAGIGVMYFWHIPSVYDYLTNYSPGAAHFFLPWVNTLSLLIGGLLFIWPILTPIKEFQINSLVKGILYLFIACVACSLLGMVMSFSSPGFYQSIFSGRPAGSLIWGFTQAGDQAIGGLIMWVPGCFIFVSISMVLLARWFSDAKTEAVVPSELLKAPSVN